MKSSLHSGFTLIELMVTISIIGILSTIATPLMFEQVERTRQKLDLVKLFYLRDALNKALVEDENALYSSDYITNDDIKNKVTTALTRDKGLVLFVFAGQQGSRT
jgi:prepilin-type N-terminal cleavage/methylation domain-containing protein